MFAPEGEGCLQRAKREDAGRFSREGKSLDDFCRAFGHSKAREKKSCFMLKITPHPPLSRATFLAAARSRSGSDSPRAVILSPRAASLPAGEGSSSAFSFAKAGAKEKAIKKKTPKEDFALCGARQRLRVYPVSATPTHMLRICVNPLECGTF